MTINFDDLDNPEYADLTLSDEQKGRLVTKGRLALAVAALRNLFPTDGSKVELLHVCVTGGHKQRCSCGSTNIFRNEGKRNGRCQNCYREFSFTANSEFFKGLKAVEAWGFYLTLKELGYVFSNAMFSAVMGISTSTARSMTLKVNAAILGVLKAEEDLLQAPSSLLIETFSRRSVLTPSNEHPSAEQKLMEEQQKKDQEKEDSDNGWQKRSDRDQYEKKEQSDSQKQGKNDEEERKENEKEQAASETVDDTIIGDSVSPPKNSAQNNLAPVEAELTVLQQAVLSALDVKPTQFDQLLEKIDAPINKLLSELTILELRGFIDQKPGDCYALSLKLVNKSAVIILKEASESLKLYVQSTIDHIKEVHHGVARKYVELYSADAYRARCQRKGCRGFSVCAACRDIENVITYDLRSFNSPLQIAITTSAQLAA